MMKILILGTGSAQKDIIEYCKENGFTVYAISNVAGYSAEKLADEFYQIDIVDTEKITKLVKEKNIDFVYSIGSDVAMPSVVKVSETLDLPCFIEADTAFICHNKPLLRQTLGENTEGNIPYQVIENPDEEIRISFPAMMKPSDSQGQRGVRKVDNIEDVNRFFEETIGFSREKKVILESFIDGDEISVNVFLENGDIKFYLISDRKVWEEYPGGIIKEHIIPSRYEEDHQISRKIRSLVENTLAAINLKNGPAYFQIKISSKGEPYLIEVTPRLDGCHMWRLIEYATGVNLLQASIDLLLGKPYGQKEDFDVSPYSLEFMCGKPGEVFSKSNYDIPEHVHLRWYYEEGRTVNRMNGYCEKCGYIIKKGN